MGRYNNGYEPLFRNREQQYNDPMSMYVDPNLNVLANSLGAIQKKHDENYAAMSAFDIMASNIQVAEGDAQLKAEALAKLKAQKDAIAASGDYALATPRIGMAVRDFSTNQVLNDSQENFKAIQAYEKRRQELGASALDFNPATNWTTVDPITQKSRRFVADVEARKDWDARAQSVTKLVADASNIPLGDAGVRGYLSSGSISGISDAKVRAYADNASRRFMQSEEGAQMYRALTKGANGARPMSDDEARGEIARFMYDVGSAQIHQKKDINYQVNQPMMQEDSQAHSSAMQERGFEHDKEMEELRYKKAMDLAKAKAEEEAKAKGLKPDEITLSPVTNLMTAAAKVGGTAISDKELEKLGFVPNTFKDAEGNDYKGFLAQNAILDFGTKFKPASGNYSYKEVEQATKFFSAKNRLDKAEKELKLAQNSPAPGGALDNRGYSVPLEGASTKYARWEAEVAKARAEFEKVKGYATTAKKYESALAGDKVELANSIGLKIANANLPFTSAQGTNNLELVDGKFAIKGKSRLTNEQLEARFNSKEIDYMTELGILTTDNNDNHTLTFNTTQVPSSVIAEGYDLRTIGAKDAFANSVPLSTARTSTMEVLAQKGITAAKLDELPAKNRPSVADELENTYSIALRAVQQQGVTVDANTLAKDKADMKRARTILQDYDNASHKDQEFVQELLIGYGIEL